MSIVIANGCDLQAAGVEHDSIIIDDSRADGIGNASRVTCPVLVLNNTADLACTPSHAKRLFDAVASREKEYHDVMGADHYYIEKPELLPQAVGLCSDWIARVMD